VLLKVFAGRKGKLEMKETPKADVERHADQFPGLAAENPQDRPTLGANWKLGISLPST
jgi:hypothetical protein